MGSHLKAQSQKLQEDHHDNYDANYSRDDKLRRRSKSYGNVSHDDERFEVQNSSSPRRHKSGSEARTTDSGKRKHTSESKVNLIN